MSYTGASFGHTGFGQTGAGPGGQPVVVNYVVTKTGKTGTANLTTEPNCGSMFAVQHILRGLGFPINVDGVRGPNTNLALTTFAVPRGILYDSSKGPPSGVLCQELVKAFLERYPGTAPSAPAPTGPPAIPTCPPGTTGIPPLCVTVPGAPPAPTPTPPLAPVTPGAPPAAPPFRPAQAAMVGPGWWTARSDNEKLLIGGAALVLGLVALGAVVKKSREKKLAANRRRRRYRANRKKKPRKVAMRARERKRARRRRRGKRRAITCKVAPEIASCRCSPPAKYRAMGATKASDYALPECFMYPLHMRSRAQSVKHTRNAASRFGRILNDPKLRRTYPKWALKKIAKRIDAAKKKYGIGEYRLAA